MARKTYTPQQKEAARAARAEKVEQMHDELSAAVDALMQSGRWLRWLDFLGSFHRYSFNNTMLIQVQCPHATQVAGFKAWQAKGRQVRKGEKGIRIFGKPFRLVSETDEATGETTRKAIKCPPPVVSVFDISQTDPIEGVEQLTAPVAQLQGDDHAALYERISEWMTGQGWTVTREQIPGESNGYCTVDGTRRIVVDADLSDAHAAKTAIHEAAHAILHTDDEGTLTTEPDQATRELEAESVAYVVAALHDLDTSDYSVGYLASWSGGQADTIKVTAVRVQEAVHLIADALTDEDQDEEATG
ncbi:MULTISPECIES: ArdC-like ssDNA-binding domain-containing protein [Dietzia]|uniref:ArdC-like ssDNA-binding domain-containing protein n=1 Tax=Dietzia TaxID=37914 RepID=UPI0020981FB3|nr:MULTISPECIES: ArdC-like ssDNA-binding domain-containing protein [Dietzia]MCT1435296.1 ArdC-like ssDNA-binding domain-containing protein [Dietzia maris]MCT2174577.1 ArdC-like ssDNA-binding domain-containing protein [Dietzia cinnamea]MDV3357154.1 ArdC-like ssDNA-binding domain-containing protein [Dietzia sp. IN118]USX47892.1 ArdC-like ssDNA-binding domain-containing protein [Dietzia kunjamensis]